jgi:hypothetical protein
MQHGDRRCWQVAACHGWRRICILPALPNDAKPRWRLMPLPLAPSQILVAADGGAFACFPALPQPMSVDGHACACRWRSANVFDRPRMAAPLLLPGLPEAHIRCWFCMSLPMALSPLLLAADDGVFVATANVLLAN